MYRNQFLSDKKLMLITFLFSALCVFTTACFEEKGELVDGVVTAEVLTHSDVPTYEQTTGEKFPASFGKATPEISESVLPCAPCSNQLTVLLKGRDNFNNICLNTIASRAIYESSGNSVFNGEVPFYNLQTQGTGQTGYIAYLPAYDICHGSDIDLKLCKYPAVGESCNYPCYDYDIYIFTTNQPTQILAPLCSKVLTDSCSTITIGNFDCCVPNTRDCIFNELTPYGNLNDCGNNCN